MTLKKIACLASVMLALAGSLSAAPASRQSGRWQQWMNNYYLNPQPELVVQAAHALSSTGYFEQPGAVATSIGFFSQVFAAHPERVDSWLARTGDLPQNHRRLIAVAAWYSGHASGEKLVRQLGVSSAYRAEIERTVSRVQGNVATTPVLSESSMNLQWGAFLATGADEHVVSILTGMGRGNLAESARVVLAFNAAQHDRVLEICRQQLDRQPNEVRSILRTVINDAERKEPTT